MDFKKPEFTLTLFITFIIASYVELNFKGSSYLAVIFFVISLFLLAKLKEKGHKNLKPSKKLTVLGIALIIFDVLYNFKTGSDVQTLDTMLIFLGISMVSLSIKNHHIRGMGEFGVYMSSIFLLFFSILYLIPARLGSNIYDYYGYYLITLPALFSLKSMNIPLYMDSLTTFHIYGAEDIYYKIDLGCFGFYSILLIISTALAYRITSPLKNSHSILKIIVILVAASYLANLLRIIALAVIGFHYGRETMLVYHAFLGWALFAAIVLPIAYVFLKVTPASASSNC